MQRCLLLALLPLFAVSSVARSELIVHYDFNNNALDSSGHSNNGSRYGSSFVSGEYDGAIYFNNAYNNSINYVSLPDLSGVPGLSNSSFTFALKYKTTDDARNNGRLFGGNGMNFNYNAGATAHAYGLLQFADGGVFYGYPSSDPNSLTVDGKWHWAVVAVDRAVHKIDFYIDAHLIEEKTFANTGAVSFSNLAIGRDNAHGGYGATLTTVDDFRLYNTSLSADDVARLGAPPSVVPEPSTLVALSSVGAIGLVIAYRRRKRMAT